MKAATSNRKSGFGFWNPAMRLLLKHDIKASITVFFVALPLCLGIALASGVPIASGLISGIIGGLIVTLFSRSQLSVSGPAAGLTAICAAAIIQMGSLELFFLSVAAAGIFQIVLGTLKLGTFTQFIPSAVIKGMLAAIGVLLISKQIPPLIGYDRPEFWTNEFFNIITFNHVYSNINSLLFHLSPGSIIIAISTMAVLVLWKSYFSKKYPLIPASFLAVLTGIIIAMIFDKYVPVLKLSPGQFVQIAPGIFSSIKLPDIHLLFTSDLIWKNAVVICFVASLETLLSLTAIDKLDPYNRVSPQNRELIAQGTANIMSGMLGGLPITAVIVRSSANAEAGARTRFAAFFHGIWLLIAVIAGISVLNLIPYSVLSVILIRTGYNLAKPKMVAAVYRQGREQFMPFIITVVSILFTDLLVGVLIGAAYSIYYLIKHTYRAGYKVNVIDLGHTKKFEIELALNVSFLNKKRIIDLLDSVPAYSIVEVTGTKSVYIDRDVLEIFQEFKSKAHGRHIELILSDIPDVEIIGLH